MLLGGICVCVSKITGSTFFFLKQKVTASSKIYDLCVGDTIAQYLLTTGRADGGVACQSQQPGIQPQSPTWVAGTHLDDPFHNVHDQEAEMWE